MVSAPDFESKRPRIEPSQGRDFSSKKNVFHLNKRILLLETPPWLTTFKNPLNDWRAINLKKNVDHFSRGLIRDNKASLLDFRNYLFSRQCALLLSLKQPWEVCKIFLFIKC